MIIGNGKQHKDLMERVVLASKSALMTCKAWKKSYKALINGSTIVYKIILIKFIN